MFEWTIKWPVKYQLQCIVGSHWVANSQRIVFDSSRLHPLYYNTGKSDVCNVYAMYAWTKQKANQKHRLRLAALSFNNAEVGPVRASFLISFWRLNGSCALSSIRRIYHLISSYHCGKLSSFTILHKTLWTIKRFSN